MITRKADSGRRVDTSKVEVRLRAEACEVIAIGRTHAAAGNMEEAEKWALYLAALYGLLGSEWSLMTITMQESDL